MTEAANHYTHSTAVWSNVFGLRSMHSQPTLIIIRIIIIQSIYKGPYKEQSETRETNEQKLIQKPATSQEKTK